jgi:hypothetical protein
MNPRAPLFRKVAYLSALLLLAIPIIYLGAPSTKVEAGGKLAQLRTENRLGQADIGAIDPASETIRLATLGLRGVAVTMLWSKANELKKTEDWTGFQAALEQLARLQPYFIKVWEYQAWNLSYNVSVEVDNVRDRFYYVKQGIQYLKEGIGYNRDNPTLLDDLGWFTGNKVGRADEHAIYRQLFKLDEDLNPEGDLTARDNWLVSKGWYEQAVKSVDVGGQPLGTKNPTTFFDSPARSQISYAEAIETEGVFGQLAKRAWQEGAKLWREYGERDMPSTEEFTIALLDLQKWQDEEKKLRAELDAMSPGLDVQMKDEAVAGFTPEQRAIYETPPTNPTAEESKLQQEVSAAVDVTLAEIAARIAKEQPDKAAEARRLATGIDNARRRVGSIESNRDVSNYEYWRIRCDLEQTPEALNARRLAHEAKRQFDEGDLLGAKDLYERSFDDWSKALAQFPELPIDSTTGSDIVDVVEEYVLVLNQMDLRLSDEEVADRFALWDLVKANDGQRKFAPEIEIYDARVTGKPISKPAGPSKSLINPADAIPQ